MTSNSNCSNRKCNRRANTWVTDPLTNRKVYLCGTCAKAYLGQFKDKKGKKEKKTKPVT